ncbi:MAG: toprim domain-containing protein [Patescibacteria group bacterium]
MIDIEFQQKKELILDAIDIFVEIGQFTQVKPNGEARCPLPSHGSDDKHPSFHVYEDTQSWYCFAENVGGNVIDFYMRLRNQTFWDIFKELAQKTGIPLKDFTPEEKKKVEDQRTIDDILQDTALFYSQNFTDEAKNYLLNDRKLTEDTIKENRLGLSGGGLKNFLFNDKQYPSALCLDSGVLKEFKKEDGTTFIGDYFYEKRIIIPIIKNGKAVHFIGRSLDESKPKYLLKSGAKTYLPGEENITKNRVFVVEGIFDWLMAKQRGIPAIALVGTSLDSEKAKKFKCEEIIIALDPDKAGSAAIIEVGKLFGQRAKVLKLPKGQDPDQYILSHSDEAIEKTLAKLPFFYSYWIRTIPKKIDKKELPKKLEPILRQLSTEEDIYCEAYLDEIKEHFELKPKARTAYSKQITKFREEKKTKEKKAQEKQTSGFSLFNEPKSIDYLFHPALTIDKEHQRILVGTPKQIPTFVDGKVVYEEQITLLCNNGEKWKLVEEEITKRGWYPSTTPSFGLGKARCSEKFIDSLTVIPRCDHGDQCYQIKQANNPYTDIFLPIKNTFEHFLDFSNSPAYSTVITLWVIGTYLFVLFPAYPYLHPNGFKESGKTKLGEIIARLAFNAESASNSSASALFRTIEANLPTFLLDEAEQLTGLEDNPDLRLIFNAGYKVNNPVKRVNPNTLKVESFNIYSPKVIISINPLDRTLASRAIPIIMLRTANSEIGKRKVTDNAADWQKLRDSLYTFLFHHALCIGDIYDNPTYLSRLNNRDEEVYSPLFAIAHFIDSYIPSDQQKLLPIVDTFASETASEEEGLDDWSLWILQAIDELVTDYRQYLIKDVRAKIVSNRQEAGETLDDRFSNRFIGTTLRKFGFKRGPNQREGKTYRLKREAIENLKPRYGLLPKEDGHKGHDGHTSESDIIPLLDIPTNEKPDEVGQEALFSTSNVPDISAFIQVLREVEDKNIIGLLPAFKKISEYENDEILIYLDAVYGVLSNDKAENKNLYLKVIEILEVEAGKRGIDIAHLQKPRGNEGSENL